METECDVNAKELMESVVSFVRSFGLHRPEQTPCGQPVPVAEAHALMDLAAFGSMLSFPLAIGEKQGQPVGATDGSGRPDSARV